MTDTRQVCVFCKIFDTDTSYDPLRRSMPFDDDNEWLRVLDTKHFTMRSPSIERLATNQICYSHYTKLVAYEILPYPERENPRTRWFFEPGDPWQILYKYYNIDYKYYNCPDLIVKWFTPLLPAMRKVDGDGQTKPPIGHSSTSNSGGGHETTLKRESSKQDGSSSPTSRPKRTRTEKEHGVEGQESYTSGTRTGLRNTSQRNCKRLVNSLGLTSEKASKQNSQVYGQKLEDHGDEICNKVDTMPDKVMVERQLESNKDGCKETANLGTAATNVNVSVEPDKNIAKRKPRKSANPVKIPRELFQREVAGVPQSKAEHAATTNLSDPGSSEQAHQAKAAKQKENRLSSKGPLVYVINGIKDDILPRVHSYLDYLTVEISGPKAITNCCDKRRRSLLQQNNNSVTPSADKRRVNQECNCSSDKNPTKRATASNYVGTDNECNQALYADLLSKLRKHKNKLIPTVLSPNDYFTVEVTLSRPTDAMAAATNCCAIHKHRFIVPIERQDGINTCETLNLMMWIEVEKDLVEIVPLSCKQSELFVQIVDSPDWPLH